EDGRALEGAVDTGRCGGVAGAVEGRHGEPDGVAGGEAAGGGDRGLAPVEMDRAVGVAGGDRSTAVLVEGGGERVRLPGDGSESGGAGVGVAELPVVVGVAEVGGADQVVAAGAVGEHGVARGGEDGRA